VPLGGLPVVPTRRAKIEPLAYGDRSSEVIAEPPPQGVLGTNLKYAPAAAPTFAESSLP
jgi:hypothetical protein